jgi:thiol:disulfide interchange protein DsbD
LEPKLKESYFEHARPFTWTREAVVLPDAQPGTLKVPVEVSYIACDEKSCDPRATEVMYVEFEVTPDEPLALADDVRSRLNAKDPEPEVVSVGGPKSAETATPAVAKKGEEKGAVVGPITISHEQYAERMDALARQFTKRDVEQSGLLAFVLAGIFWGAVSLVTPCVFPMIPITVSFFLKQSEKEHHRPVVMASVYSLTIVVVLTLAAAFLLSVFVWLSINPILNYFLGGLFIFFALSLFGMYEIELPSGMARFTSSREGRGGLVGTMFMALTFTIISFACVAPFLGGFGGTAAAARPLWHNLLGGLAFSATFAAPFFLLALFPSLLRSMPKSGSWLNSVKVVMGFLELAAAFKFFRSAELVQTGGVPTFFTFDLVLGIWVALCLLAGLYLIGVFNLPHDTPAESISVPRLLFAIVFFGLGFYLSPALFKTGQAAGNQPGGAVYAWVDSFLLPEARAGQAGDMPKTGNLDWAVAEARDYRKRTGQPKRIFIDFTGFS